MKLKTIFASALLVFLLTIFSSCGSLKRNKQKKKVETVTDSTVNRHTEITEAIDTTVIIASDTMQGEKSLNEILQGDSLIVEDETQKIIVRYNSATKKVKAEGMVKPKEITVKMERKTVSDEKVQIHKESKEETKGKIMESEGLPNWLKWLIGIVLFCFGVVITGWLLGFAKRRKQ